MSKTVSAMNTLREVNPAVEVVLHNAKVTADNIGGIIQDYDFIIDGADKKVYIFCQSGEISGEFVELLCDAEYDAYHFPAGYLGISEKCF